MQRFSNVYIKCATTASYATSSTPSTASSCASPWGTPAWQPRPNTTAVVVLQEHVFFNYLAAIVSILDLLIHKPAGMLGLCKRLGPGAVQRPQQP